MSNKQSSAAAEQKANQSSLYLYRRLISYALPYWHIFVIAVIGMVIVAGSSAAFPALMQPLMDSSFVERDSATIKWMPFAIIGIFAVRVVGAFISSYGMNLIGRNVIRVLRKEMFSRLIS